VRNKPMKNEILAITTGIMILSEAEKKGTPDSSGNPQVNQFNPHQDRSHWESERQYSDNPITAAFAYGISKVRRSQSQWPTQNHYTARLGI
jgi:hypothetical protein